MAAYYNEIEPWQHPKKWVIYVITHKESGKSYVGISNRPERRWKEHLRSASKGAKTAMAAAIRKYGEDAFLMACIACSHSWVDACTAEKYFIKELNTKSPFGFNLTDGGEGCGGLPADILERIATKNRGRKMPLESVERRVRAQRGVKRSDEMKALISAARKGKPLSKEHCEKLAKAKLGKKLPPRSNEHSSKISDGLRAAWARKLGKEPLE